MNPLDYMNSAETEAAEAALLNGQIPFFKPRKNTKKGQNPHAFIIVKPDYFPERSGDQIYMPPSIAARVYRKGKDYKSKRMLDPSPFGLPDPFPKIAEHWEKNGRGEDGPKPEFSFWALVIDLEPEDGNTPHLAIWNYNASMQGRIDALVKSKFAPKGPWWGWNRSAAFLLDRYKNKSKDEVDLSFHPTQPQSVKEWLAAAGVKESTYIAMKERANGYDLCRWLMVETEETIIQYYQNLQEYDNDEAKQRRELRDDQLKQQGKYPYAPSFIARNNAPLQTPPPPPPPPPVQPNAALQAATLD